MASQCVVIDLPLPVPCGLYAMLAVEGGGVAEMASDSRHSLRNDAVASRLRVAALPDLQVRAVHGDQNITERLPLHHPVQHGCGLVGLTVMSLRDAPILVPTANFTACR